MPRTKQPNGKENEEEDKDGGAHHAPNEEAQGAPPNEAEGAREAPNDEEDTEEQNTPEEDTRAQ